MSHYPEDESPWGSSLTNVFGGGGFIDPEDGVSPWTQHNDDDEDKDSHDVTASEPQHHEPESSTYGTHSFYGGSRFGAMEQSGFTSYGLEPAIYGGGDDGDEEEDEEHNEAPRVADPSAASDNNDDDNDPLANLTAQRNKKNDLAFTQSSSAPAPPTPQTRASKRRGRAVQSAKRESVGATPLGPLDSGASKALRDDMDDVSLAMSTHTLDDPVRTAMESGTVKERAGSIAPSVNSAASNNMAFASVSPWSSALVPETDTAPKYKFDIHVTDPTRVGELTNQYTVYTVNIDTDLEYEKQRASVLRRYRDFRWLYRALEHSHPGIIVPPPPDKQAVGRFNDDFVQQRRSALESMLRKIASNPNLRMDRDLEAFLTEEDFPEYLRNRVLSYEELEAAQQTPAEPTGFMNALLGKGGEPDAWLVQRRNRLDTVELQLKSVFKALDAVSAQRQELSDAVADFANATEALANIEPTRQLGEVLAAFGEVHAKLAQLYSRQRQQDMLTLEATLDEHLRLVGSARDALASRQRVAAQADAAAFELEKQQNSLDKLRRKGSSQEDRHAALEEDVAHLSERAHAAHQQAADVAHRVDSELQRLDKEKMAELRNSVELYLENAIEAQKEAIETWETFYTRHFARAQATS